MWVTLFVAPKASTYTLKPEPQPKPACCTPTGATGKGGVISVNYDGFIDDVSVGDELLVDGGIISFVVRGKTDTDVQVRLREAEAKHVPILDLITALAV